MEKILVELHIPVNGKQYDIELPSNILIHQAVELISDFFKGNQGELFTPDGSTVLCDLASGQILDINKTVFELGLANGSKLLLI
ncbi:MAG: EsaB/YukD family protein [Butyrivibrio sp.]|nr:EsaB/YukD family protein [Butyrivibrio sp.]